MGGRCGEGGGGPERGGGNGWTLERSGGRTGGGCLPVASSSSIFFSASGDIDLLGLCVQSLGNPRCAQQEERDTVRQARSEQSRLKAALVESQVRTRHSARSRRSWAARTPMRAAEEPSPSMGGWGRGAGPSILWLSCAPLAPPSPCRRAPQAWSLSCRRRAPPTPRSLARFVVVV